MEYYLVSQPQVHIVVLLHGWGWRRTRWWRSRWTWSTSLSTDTSGIHLQTQKWMQNTSWKWTGVPDQQKRIYRPMQNSVGWTEQGGRTGILIGLDLPSASRGPIPTSGQLSESEEKQLRLRVEQLICGSLNGMRNRQSLLQPCIPQMVQQLRAEV